MALDPTLPPSGNFNLTRWKIGLPIDVNGAYVGTATEVKHLIGYQHPTYFYTGPDGAMTFAAPVEGSTTSGSNYARSELLEMNGTARAAWNLEQGGFMTATLEIDRAPIKFSGVAGRIVIGQIHGLDNELVRLYWENGRIYFVNGLAGATNVSTTFNLTNANGQQPNVSLDEQFSYTIHAKNNDLLVSVEADGQTYTSVTRINDIWDTDVFYFKAGAYLGVNETQGTGWGQTSFYGLSVNHDGTAPVDHPVVAVNDTYATTQGATLTIAAAQGVLINDAAENGGKVAVAGTFPTSAGGSVSVESSGAFTYAPKIGFSGQDSFIYTVKDADNDSADGTVAISVNGSSPTRPVTTRTFTGTSSGNTLTGSSGNDLIDGKSGDDRLYGKGGSDVLIGGSGRDYFIFDTSLGSTNNDVIVDFIPVDDTIRLENAVFTRLTSTGTLSSSLFRLGPKALDSNDYIVYDGATGALYYDSDGSGSRAAVQFALIEEKASLTTSDLVVI
jgi:Ca2+-binding RTX toxin-like protein